MLDDYPNTHISDTIDEWIRGERNRKILKMRLIDCKTLERIAEDCGISVTTVKKVIKNGKPVILSHI